jgi:hypothetical protein
MMKRVHEFEVWSTKGKLLPVDYGKDLRDELLASGIFANHGIPDDVFIGLSNIPDKIDVHNLKMDIKEGVLTMEGFITFCHEYGLEPNIESNFSANKYLEYTYGSPIAWIHIPDGSEIRTLPLIIEIMNERGHIVIETGTEKKVALDSSGLIIYIS